MHEDITMKFRIEHESRRRMRITAYVFGNMKPKEADELQYFLMDHEGVDDAVVHERSGSATIRYSCTREDMIEILKQFEFGQHTALVPSNTGRELNNKYQDRLFWMIVRKSFRRVCMPMPIRMVWCGIKTLRYIIKAVRSLKSGTLKVEVLDAAAVTAAYITGDFSTAGSVMFLLEIGELLEEWTHKKSVDDLARAMSLNIDRVWVKTEDGTEVDIPASQVKEGNCIIVRTGSTIPFDGTTVDGDAMVNQASMTGESVPVHKGEGSSVYAGTVIDEGELVIRVKATQGDTRYEKIVRMIEDSEKMKSELEINAASVADGLVPYCFGATALTYLLTGNITRAISVLMVDFSCALKLSMPISVLSAMREAGGHKITVKGGKYLEAVSEADTIVFDKTGTLTMGNPMVSSIVTFGKNDETEILRLAACLEEHFPHSMANAVVAEAKRRGVEHEEKHAKVDYIVAHGISSSIDGHKVVIGSYHFVFEDEGCTILKKDQKKFDGLDPFYSHLYMAIGGKLAAVILISDPVREEAKEVVDRLHEYGIKNVVMMTGDSKRTAEEIARQVGVDRFYAEVLPEDKAAFIKAEREAGRKVIMVGDGINDTPALSAADVGIAISEGAEIAREVADITIGAEDLRQLLVLRKLSERLMERIRFNYRFVIGFNSLLIALGIGGIIQPASSALMHNGSTIFLSLKSMTNLMEPGLIYTV